MALPRWGSGRTTWRKRPPDPPFAAFFLKETGPTRPVPFVAPTMTESIARLYLVTPLIEDGSRFAPALSQACAAGEIAAVLLRLAPGDERASVNRVKALAPAAQEHGAAVLVTAAGEVDLAAVATRGGADGVHLAVPDPNAASALRERLKDRSIGAGGLRSKDDAMTIGEGGIDYLMFCEP